jgi:hypothetical protein
MLNDDSNRNGIDFVKTELDLSMTFAESALGLYWSNRLEMPVLILIVLLARVWPVGNLCFAVQTFYVVEWLPVAGEDTHSD